MDWKKFLPLITAIIGFLAAWVLKPAPESTTSAKDDATTAKPRSGASSGRNETTKNTNTTSKTPIDASLTSDGKPLPPDLAELRMGMAEKLRQGYATRDHGYVRRIGELLNLTTEQQHEVLQLLQLKREKLNIFHAGAGVNHSNLLEQAEAAEAEYHDALAAMLDASQIDKLNAYQKQKSVNRSLAKAKTAFADVLEKIDLSADQQQSVETALRDHTLQQQPEYDKTNLMYEAYETMGYGPAARNMAASSAANSAIKQAPDTTAMLSEVVQRRKQESDSLITALTPILTPAQMEQYKAIVEARDTSFYANLQPLMNPAPAPLPNAPDQR